MRFFGWFRRKPAAGPSAGPSGRWTLWGGRRILINTPYIIPKSAAEGDRLDLQHHLLKLVASGNYRAPLRQVRSILDVACGTGIWGREMAHEFPKARIIGVDLDRTPMDASLARLGPSGHFPPNFQFQEADVLQRLPEGIGTTFDFVHARFIAGFVPVERWVGVVSELLRVTRPGGYVELVEPVGNPVSKSPAFTTLMDTVAKLGQSRNLDQHPGEHLTDYLRQAGTERIQQRRFEIGTGRQAARQQRLLATDMLSFIKQMEPILLRLQLLTQDEYKGLLTRAEKELLRLGISLPVVFAYGMKPLAN